jgi:undecaprenyl-diphosphatase
MQSKWRILPALLAALMYVPAHAANDGPFGIDHEWGLDNDGIWSRNYQNLLEYGVIATEVGGALWLGNDDRFGHALWQTVDSSAVAAVSAELLKRAFSRARPDQIDNPNRWFQGGCCDSFPSGEVTLQASFVTPIIIDYQREHPWIWLLELLPAYDAVGRLKNQAHWQSDVIAGWALGSVTGYWSTARQTPLSVTLLPRGLSVGFSKRF